MKIQPALLFTALCLPLAHAEFTYVDANPTNTTLNGVTLLDRNTDPIDGNYFNQFNTPNVIGTATDTFWSFNNLAGYESSNYFQCDNVSTADDAEATAPLVTTINLPTIGTYKVLAMFTRSSSRDIAAKIGSAPGAADVFTIVNAANASQTLVPLQIDFDSSYTDGRTQNAGAAFLGQITTTVPNQAVQIYVNGLVGIDGTQDERTQYDGIGYELVPAATGEFTYVDASISNTTLNSDPVNSPSGVALVDITADPINGNCVNDGVGGGVGSDSLWAFRTDIAAAGTYEGASFFESDNGTEFGTNTGTDRETTPDLITTITPPVAGVYQVVAVFTKTSLRDITAKIGSSPGPGNGFSDTNALEANQLASPLEIDFDSGFTNSRTVNAGAAYLGTVVTTTANEAVKVYVNGRAHNAINDDERTQYDGIAYRLVSSGNGNTYANWISSGFNVGVMNGVGDDADGDGTGNGVENFFGTAPDAFSAGLLAGTKSGNTFTFTHPQSATPATDLSPSYKWSTDLASWYLGNGIDGPGGSTVTLTPNTLSGTTTVTATTSGPQPQLFLRIQVQQN